jgi:hypothetical protein
MWSVLLLARMAVLLLQELPDRYVLRSMLRRRLLPLQPQTK